MGRRFAVSAEGLAEALAFVDTFARSAALAEDIRRRAAIIVDELCGNMLRHDASLKEDAAFDLTLTPIGDGVRIVVRDHGLPFDPTGHRHDVRPDIGGQGIELVRQFSRVFDYARDGDANVITVEVGPGPVGDIRRPRP